jgi:hypothetical protein
MIKRLKDPDILSRKPELKLYPNYYHYISDHGRIWKSEHRGTAYADGRGWYSQLRREK